MPAASELPRKCAKTFSRTKPEMGVRKMPAATSTAKPPRGLAEFTSDTSRKIPALMEVIRIAGAGPSGLAAAIVLARAGRKVEVHEAKRDVGMRFIGDLQVIEGASERETVPNFLDRIGLERNFYFRPATWATFYDHRGKARTIRSGQPYGYFIRRGAEEGTLDRGLLAQARALGVDVRFNSRLADADIIATGPAAPDGLAREMTWRTSDEERIDVFFNHHLAPGAYSYLLLLDALAPLASAPPQ